MSRSILIVLAATLAAAPALAMSSNVISTFRGQLIVSKDEIPEGKNDHDTIAKIHSAQLKELTGTPQNDVTIWNFHYTAFLSKTGATALKMNFLTGQEHRLSADKQLDGVDPKSNVLTGDIQIDEDEGLAKGKTYDVEILAGNTTVAKATVTFK
jgi:hypothetical protein